VLELVEDAACLTVGIAGARELLLQRGHVEISGDRGWQSLPRRFGCGWGSGGVRRRFDRDRSAGAGRLVAGEGEERQSGEDNVTSLHAANLALDTPHCHRKDPR